MEELFHSVNECWPGSSLQEFSDMVAPYSGESHNIWLAGIASLTFLLCLVFFNQITSAVSVAFSCFVGGSPRKCYENQYITNIVNLTALLAFVVIDLVMYVFGITGLGFFYLPLALIGVVFARWSIVELFKWLRSNAEMWKMVKTTAKSSLIVAAVLLIPSIMVLYFNFLEISPFIKYYSLVVVCIAYLVYIIRSSAIIFSSGCSIFFWFLYLCALEFLPLGIFISAFVRL